MPCSNYSKLKQDKVFDGLASKFQEKIYGSLKGKIRLAVITRDLDQAVFCKANTKLKVLDLGAGAGLLSIRLANQGHKVTYNDASTDMACLAKKNAATENLAERIEWHIKPYQTLVSELVDGGETFDLILCHALIEWLTDPKALIEAITPLLSANGKLSLCFYNPVGKIYRNLIRGNFDYLGEQNKSTPNEESFTPTFTAQLPTVIGWIENLNFNIESLSGIRVFSDYVVEKRGGLADPAQIIEQELTYSQISPYREMGRYLHIIAQR